MASAIKRFRPTVNCSGRIEVPTVPGARTSFADVPFIDVPLMDVEGEAAVIQPPYEGNDTDAIVQPGEIHRSLNAAASRWLEFGACSCGLGREWCGNSVRGQRIVRRWKRRQGLRLLVCCACGYRK